MKLTLLLLVLGMIGLAGALRPAERNGGSIEEEFALSTASQSLTPLGLDEGPLAEGESKHEDLQISSEKVESRR